MRHRITLFGLLFFFHTLIMGSGFGTGTLVYTHAGLVPIEQVATGSLVYCYDTQAVATQKVLEKKISLEKSYLLITLDTHETIVVSRLHKFYVPHAEVWKQACELQVHDMVLHYDGTYATIQEIKHVQKPIVLYDLSVEHNHNYFVSRQGLLVHNFEPVIALTLTWIIGSGTVDAAIKLGILGAVLVGKLCLGNRSSKDSDSRMIPVSEQWKPPHEFTCSAESPSGYHITDNVSISGSIDATKAIERLVQKNLSSATHESCGQAATPHETTKEQSAALVESENNPQNPDDNQHNCTRLDPTPKDIPTGCGGNIKTEPQQPGCFPPVPQLPIHTGGQKVPEDISKKNPGCGGGVIVLPIHTGNTNPIPLGGPIVFKIKSISLPEDRLRQAGAPGKPTVEDGFIPAKNWDGEKVKHPKTNQWGYPDKKGDIWVPTGPIGAPLAHGGPHWDVVDKRGDGINIMPGGHERGYKK